MMVKPFRDLHKSQKADKLRQFWDLMNKISGNKPEDLLEDFFLTNNGKSVLPKLSNKLSSPKLDTIIENIRSYREMGNKNEKKQMLSILSTTFTRKELCAQHNFQIS